MRFVTWLLSTGAALAVATWMLDGIWFEGAVEGRAELADKWQAWLVVSLILGVLNSIVAPALKLLGLPFVILTLGLFLWVVNAWMLMLSGWIAGEVGLGFHVSGFWTALLGALVITVVGWGANLLLGRDE